MSFVFSLVDKGHQDKNRHFTYEWQEAARHYHVVYIMGSNCIARNHEANWSQPIHGSNPQSYFHYAETLKVSRLNNSSLKRTLTLV